MLSENQVKRLLKQAESAYNSRNEERWKGWIQSLKLVLEQDTYPIRKDQIND
jgi:hypothetical protein|tara:strand:+ start:528 stop:683 length:156 start_codon:yes stop_codon:yes gene_type:complete